MKLSKKTLEIIGLFSDINPSLYIEPGNVIKTHSVTGGSPVAKAVVDEKFPKIVCIRDIKQFLKISKLFNDPDYDFQDSKVVISDKTRESTYRYTNPETIEHPPYDKDLKLPAIDVSFKLKVDDVKSVITSANVFNMKQVMFSGDGKFIHMSCTDTDIPKNQRDKNDTFKVKVGETDETFDMIFDIPSISHINADCEMDISMAGVSHVKMTDLEIWIMPIRK